MVSQAPAPHTQDPADIGPEDLWAVWVQRPAWLVETGLEPVSVNWMLAAPGKEGLSALASPAGFSDGLWAAIPLALLRQISLALPPEPERALPGWVRAALGTNSTLFFVRDDDGSTRVVANPKDMRPGEKELLKGSRKDFDEILNEGNRIFQEKKWGKVFGDMRPFVKRGEVGWLHYQRNQKGAEALKRLIEMGRNGV